MGYEAMMLRFLEGIVEDMEKKIRKQHERLEHDERYMKQVCIRGRGRCEMVKSQEL